jgi:hypothetical protein
MTNDVHLTFSTAEEVPILPNSYGRADAEANDFFALWDNGADTDTLVRFIGKMSQLALAIVEVRFKQRDRLEAERNSDETPGSCRTAENGRGGA